jgi:hypothetical protein
LIYIEKLLLVAKHSIAKSLLENASFKGGVERNIKVIIAK